MGRGTMANPPSFLSRAVFFAVVLLAACSTLSQPEPRPAAPPSSPEAAPPTDKAVEPVSSELSEATLYDLLLGEIALQRGDPAMAAQTYLDVAKRTRDPRVVRR